MNKVLNKIDKAVEHLISILLFSMLVIVCLQVFTRKILNFSLPWTEELARFLLIWITMLGSAVAVKRKAHIGIALLVQKLTGQSRKTVQLFSHVVVVVFSLLVMVVGGAILISLPLISGQTSPGLHLKYGYIYLAMPLGGILNIFYALRLFVEEFKMNSLKGKA
jgi:TRAP-type C4-dicarboxylate transport system permease small subunit